ncbi:MAG TPA: heat-inducible transcriptional repressor HrcA [Vicinamibacterales bacterium]|nr:heat-inducible transcriptional repressor HrcA [Vicinamibacterales bacterium]
MGSFELPDRSRRLLATLVREYIETGEAVSSQVLARESSLGVSSATVRNVLAQLEDSGFVYQPHTSAGRVPTDRAYRVFVDQLLEGRRPAKPSATVEIRLRQQADRSPLMGDLLSDVSHLVARAARVVAFAISDNEGAILQRIEFVPLGGARVLVVVVASDGKVTQKVIEADGVLGADDLVRAANYLNTEFAGLPLLDVRDAVSARLEMDRSLYDELLRRALRLAQASLEDISRQQAFSVEGASALLENGPDGVSVATLRALLEMMDEKERMLHLLNQYIDGPGVTVVIGAEHTAPGLRPFSLIAATAVDGGATRTVGVIGPTRIDYSRTIALVDGTTQAVSRVLRSA